MNTSKAEATSKKTNKREVKLSIPFTLEQKQAKGILYNNAISILTGEAGTGKTTVAVAVALDLLFTKQVEQIIITRPAVGTEDLGFLPGSKEEKMEEWLAPIEGAIKRCYSGTSQKETTIENLKKAGKLQIVSLQHFRGRNFDNAACIVDEFQNVTKHQFQMCFTRLGKGSRMFFCGDTHQIDLPKAYLSAAHYISLIKDKAPENVAVVELLENHRNPAINGLLQMLRQNETKY
jgi:phosphate starvation-inducible PhoH-like protein